LWPLLLPIDCVPTGRLDVDLLVRLVPIASGPTHTPPWLM
jgi:hypothetical protein